jgi:hypothetical protein
VLIVRTPPNTFLVVHIHLLRYQIVKPGSLRRRDLLRSQLASFLAHQTLIRGIADLDRRMAQREKAAMGEKRTAIKTFKPSRIHKFFSWVDRLPGPYWLYYLAVLFLAGLLNQIIAWNEQVVPFGEINWYYAFTAFFLALYTFQIDFQFRFTRNSLIDFRSILEAKDDEFERIAYRFTHLPAGPTAAVFVIGIIVGFLLGWYIFPTAIEMNQAFPEMELPVFSLSFGVGYIAIYMLIRAFVLINKVYKGLRTVNIYDLDSLYALSMYSAWLIVFVIIHSYLLFILAPSLAAFAFQYLIYIDLLLVFLVLAIFWFPIRRVNRLLVLQKRGLMKDVNLRIETTFALLHTRIDQQEFRRIVELREAIQGLMIEKGFIESLRTWPWKRSTLTGLLSVVVLPLLISVLTELLSRFIGL